MSITISDTTPRVQYTAAGSQTAFSVPFEFFNNSDLVVIKTSSGTDATLTFNASPSSAAQYSVAGAGVSGGGSITLGGASTNGDIYTIYRELPISRTTDFSASGSFPVETLNTELDKIVAMSQQLERDLKFSPRASASTSNTFNLTFPNLVANKILSVNSAGNALEFDQSITDVSTVAGISSAISTVSGIASNVTTVAGIASNVTAVAGDSADIGAVAGKATEIGRLGTSDAVADLAILGTSAIVTDMDLLATSANVTAMGHLGTSANVTAMGLLGTSAVVTDMGLLGNADVIADMALLGDSDVIADMAILATSDIVSDLNTLATSDIVSDLNTLATSDIVTDINVLATSDIVSDLNTLATSDIVTDLNILGTSANVTNMATLGASGVVANIATVAGANSNISTVASNIAGVNSFADRYRIDSSDPSSSLDAGDLAFNTSSNVLKYYDGSAWQTITADTDVKTKVSSNDSTAGFLNGKLVAGDNVTFTENNNGSNETLTIAATDNSVSMAIALG